LLARKMEPPCGIYGIYDLDLSSDVVVEKLTMEDVVGELYHVAVIPNKLQPACLGPSSAELKRMIRSVKCPVPQVWP